MIMLPVEASVSQTIITMIIYLSIIIIKTRSISGNIYEIIIIITLYIITFWILLLYYMRQQLRCLLDENTRITLMTKP